MMRHFVLLVLLNAVIQICSAKQVVPVETAARLDEALVRSYTPSAVQLNGIRNIDNSGEDETDDVDPDGAGSSEQVTDEDELAPDLQQTFSLRNSIHDSPNGPQSGMDMLAMLENPDGNLGSDDVPMRMPTPVQRLLKALQVMREQNNEEALLRQQQQLLQQQQPAVDDQDDFDLMSMLRQNAFDGQMRPSDPHDLIGAQAQDGLIGDQSSEIPEAPNTGRLAIVFVPVWRVIEKTVYLVSKQPADELVSSDEMTYSPADFFFALLMGLAGLALAFVLVFAILRTIRRRRERAQFNHVKAPLFSPPAYAQPAQLTSLPTTKLDGNNISEKPPLEPSKA